MRLFVEFVPAQSPLHRQRLTDAFRLFCAIYDHELIVDPEQRIRPKHTAQPPGGKG